MEKFLSNLNLGLEQRLALDGVSPSAGLPPLGAIDEVCCQCIYSQFHLQFINYEKYYRARNFVKV